VEETEQEKDGIEIKSPRWLRPIVGSNANKRRRRRRMNFVAMETPKPDVWLTVHRNSVWIRKTN